MAGPDRIWTASTDGTCHVGFDTPSLNYTNEYIHADTVAEMIRQAVDDATSLHRVISAIREATVGVKPMLSDLPTALLEWRQAAVQAEREACAKVCEGWNEWDSYTTDIAAAIRARGVA